MGAVPVLGGSGHGAGRILTAFPGAERAAVWHLAGDREARGLSDFPGLGCSQATEFSCQRSVISPFAA